jgi:hypothetical protein
MLMEHFLCDDVGGSIMCVKWLIIAITSNILFMINNNLPVVV